MIAADPPPSRTKRRMPSRTSGSLCTMPQTLLKKTASNSLIFGYFSSSGIVAERRLECAGYFAISSIM